MRDGSRTKALIDRTALRLFVQKGIAETTIKDIAREARIAEGAMYRHYPSKDALAWDLFSRPFTGFALELDHLQRPHPTARAKLDAMIRHFCTFFDRDRTLFSYLLLAQHGQLAKVTADMPNPVEVFRKVIGGGIARKEIPKGDADVLTSIVLGIVLQVALSRVYGRVKQDLSSLADVLVAKAWGALEA
jgi:AcrR family transcriptional regulator